MVKSEFIYEEAPFPSCHASSIDQTREGLIAAWFGGTRLMWEHYGALSMLIGLLAAAVSAALAVKWLVSYLQSHGLSLFGWYRIGIGAVCAGIVMIGWIPA